MGVRYVLLFRRVGGEVVQLGFRVVAQLHAGPVFGGGLVAWLDVLPRPLNDGQGVVQVLLYDVVASVVVLSQEGGQLVAAVGGYAVGRERVVEQGGEGGVDIDHGEEGLLLAGLDARRPAYDEGDARAGLVGAVFPAPVMLHGGVPVQQFEGLVLVAVVDDGAVVATEDEDGVVGKLEAVEGVHDFAYGPVQLEDDVATGAHAALSGETGVGDAGNVDVLGAHVEEEGAGLVVDDEVLGLGGDDVGYLFIVPEGGFSAGHPADAGDAVDDGVVVSLAGLEGDEFGVFESGGPVAYFVVVADGDGVVGVEACHAAVFDEDAGHAVDGGGDDVFVVEADVLGVRADECVEVSAAFGAESEVPLADGGGGVAFCVEHVGQGDAGGVDDQFRVAGGDAGVLLPPGVHSGEEAEARGGAGGGGGVCVGELCALSGEAVDVGGVYAGCAIAAEVADAEVVGYQVDDVGFLPWGVVGCCLFGGVSASGQQGGSCREGP